jgi:hypothetical protein
VPLGFPLDKIGEARIEGARVLDLKVFAAGASVAAAAVKEEFVRGHFIELTEAERLRAPEFERYKAGVEVSSDALVVDAAKAIEEIYAYEVVLIGDEDDRTAPAPIRGHGALSGAFTTRWGQAYNDRIARPREGYPAARAADAIRVRDFGFIAETVAAGLYADPQRPREDAMAILDAASLTFSETKASSDPLTGPARAEVNRVVADYVAASQLEGTR